MPYPPQQVAEEGIIDGLTDEETGAQGGQDLLLGTPQSSSIYYPGALCLSFPWWLLGLPSFLGYENSVDLDILLW